MSFYKRSQWVSMSTGVGDISSIDISLKLQFVSVVKIETADITKPHDWVKKNVWICWNNSRTLEIIAWKKLEHEHEKLLDKKILNWVAAMSLSLKPFAVLPQNATILRSLDKTTLQTWVWVLSTQRELTETTP